MKLPVKITLLLAGIVTLFICINFYFVYDQINRNFSRQAEERMQQSVTLLNHRLEFQKQNLQSEMQQLSNSLFTENESVLAMMLAIPPEFNTDVLGFAERLRRRTTLQFLSVLSSDGIVLSNSLAPATFGKTDPFRDFPLDQPSYIYENAVCLELKTKATFGTRTLFIRGGYFLKSGTEKLALPGVSMSVQEQNSAGGAHPESSDLSQTVTLEDYRRVPVAIIALSLPQKEFLEEKQKLIRNSILLILLSLTFCLIAGHFLSVWISRPLARITEAAMAMSRGNLDVRVEEEAGGEIASLEQAFNRMAAELEEKQRKLVQTERIAAWQEIARHLAHEIKNPLTPIRTSIANLRLSQEKAPEKFPEIFQESSASILEEVEKLRHLADEFSRFARLPAPNLKVASLNEVIQRSLALYADHSPVSIRFEPGDVPPLPFDAEQVSEVIHNLVQNAVDASPEGSFVTIRTGTTESQGRKEAFFSVEDRGAGMSEQVRKQIFTPYFTTKEKGTGLGLAIVQRIVAEHGGTILVESDPGKGTKFEVKLNLQDATTNEDRVI